MESNAITNKVNIKIHPHESMSKEKDQLIKENYLKSTIDTT